MLAAFPATSLAAAPRPPTPRLTTLGVTRSASLESYCWTQRLGDGSSAGMCADGVFGTPTQSVSWRPRQAIYLDLRLPAHGVTVAAARLARTGSAPHERVALRVRPVGTSGTRWVIVVPRTALRSNVLVIGAQFAQGDVSAAIGLRRRVAAR
jgi:hypothetical protein